MDNLLAGYVIFRTFEYILRKVFLFFAHGK